jgi:MATE family multidrug resistance protein
MPIQIHSEIKTILHLAWPAVLGMLGGQLMNIVDMLMLGQLGEEAIATAGMGFLWSMPMIMFIQGCIRGMDPIVTQAHGAGEKRKAGLAFARGFVIAGLLIPPAMAWHLCAPWSLQLLEQPLKLIPQASKYCEALMWGIPGMLIYQVQRGYLQGVGIMRPAAMVMLGANLFNIPLNWMLMHGVMDIDGLGVVGCGWSTALCQSILPIWLWLVSKHDFKSIWPGKQDIIKIKALHRQLKLGIPIAFQICFEAWAFNAAGLIIGTLGPNPLAAHMIALNLATTAWMFAMGVSAAATTRVGNLLGAQKIWHISAWITICISVVLMCVSATVFVFMPETLARLYTSDADVLELAVILIPLAGAFQIVDGIQAVASGVLRGIADVRIPALGLIIAHWVIGLPLGVYWAIYGNQGAPGLWWGLVVALTLTAIFFSLRIAQLQRRGMQRI